MNRFIQRYFHRKLMVILLLGFSSGLPRLLVASTLGALLSDNALEMTSIGLFAYVALPYSFNFLWAPLVDSCQIPVLHTRLGKRQSWILVCQICLMVSIAGLGLLNPQTLPWWVAAAALLVAFFSASQDIVIDAFRTEYLEESQYGEGAAMAVFGYRLGMLVAGAGALYLAEYAGWQVTYLALALCMVVGAVTVLSVSAAPSLFSSPSSSQSLNPNPSFLTSLIAPLKDFATRYPEWLWILAFILFYRLSDGFIGFITTPFFLDIGFDKPTIASVAKIFGFGATLAGMFIGGALIARLGLFTTLWSFALFQLLANLAYVNLALTGTQIEALAIAITLDNLSGGMVTAAAIAFMMTLCRNKDYTATQYALLASLASLGSITLAGASGMIADNFGWPVMFGFSALLGLPCLAIFWVKRQAFSNLASGKKPA